MNIAPIIIKKYFNLLVKIIKIIDDKIAIKKDILSPEN